MIWLHKSECTYHVLQDDVYFVVAHYILNLLAILVNCYETRMQTEIKIL
jgi:hypothetical protein